MGGVRSDMNVINKNNSVRKWIKDNGCDGFATFDFKDKEVVLYDGSFLSIRKKIKIHRKRRKSEFGQDFKVSQLACTIYFDSLDETIDYLSKARKFLREMGYTTDGTLSTQIPISSERFNKSQSMINLR